MGRERGGTEVCVVPNEEEVGVDQGPTGREED